MSPSLAGRLALPRSHVALLALLLVSLVAAAARSLPGGGPPIGLVFFSGFPVVGYASVGVHYCLSADDRARLRFGVLALIAAALCWALAVGGAMTSKDAAKSFACSLGVAGAWAYLRDLRTSRVTKEDVRAAVAEAAIVPLGVIQLALYLWPLAQLNPVYDPFLQAFEQLTRLAWESTIVQGLDRLPLLAWFVGVAYVALPIGMAVTSRLQKPRDRVRLLWAAVIAGGCGFIFYDVCPAVGPVHAFGTSAAGLLPFSGAPTPLSVIDSVPRNAMPSLHTVWALLILFNARRLRPGWRVGLMAFAALNICATVGRFEHWVIDLIVAVPLAASIQLVTIVEGRSLVRWICGVTFAAMTLLWLVALRFGWLLELPAITSWILLAVSIVAPPAAWMYFASASEPHTRTTPAG